MLRALYSSAAGMEAQQMNLDVIANNLANVNTTGFKKSKIEFQDLLYDTTRSAGAEQSNGNQLPTGLQIGHGSRAVSTSKVFTEGELTATGERLDMAIQGDGFFQVTMPDGTLAYTRDGAFKTSATGSFQIRRAVNNNLASAVGNRPSRCSKTSRSWLSVLRSAAQSGANPAAPGLA